MTTRLARRFAALFILTGLLGGCSMLSDEQQTVTGTEAMPRLLVYDQALGYRLDLTEAQTRDTNGGRRARIAIKNDWKSPLDIHYRVVWYNSTGLKVEIPDDDWTAMTLAPQKTRTIEVDAPDDDAYDFVVHIK